jgi:error-prone DNA polymerase
MTESYVELHAASAFSFLEGASQPEKLVERAVKLEMPAMALLDRNGVYGSARFHTSAKRNGVPGTEHTKGTTDFVTTVKALAAKSN